MRACVCSTAAVLVALGAPASAQLIMNGSMDGSVGTNRAPIDWTRAQASPDVVNASGPFNNTGVLWTDSSDGGTFARMNGLMDAQTEGIEQMVSGFEPGSIYQLDFELTNLGFRNAANGSWSGFDGFVRFLVNGSEVATSITVAKQASATDPIVWSADSVQFTAPSESFELAIFAETVGGSFDIAYIGFDGLGAQLVPAPAGAAALIGGAAFAARRRR